MKSFESSIGIVVLVVPLFSACKRDEPASLGAPSASGTPATTALAVATAAVPSATTPVATSTEAAHKVCPYPRRCTEACKKAHFAAMDACSAEWKAIEQAIPNTKEMGECTARCLKSENIAGCVGAANKEECDCAEKCTQGVPPAIKDKGEPYLRCYASAVAAACN